MAKSQLYYTNTSLPMGDGLYLNVQSWYNISKKPFEEYRDDDIYCSSKEQLYYDNLSAYQEDSGASKWP